MKSKVQTDGIVGQVARIRERANLFVERELRKVNLEGVLPAHGSILYFLFQQERPISMKEVVEKVGRVKSTVTGMIKTLEQYGYVQKKASPEDGRVMLVQLTEKGRAIKPQFDAISVRLQAKLYGEMREADRAVLARLLKQVCANLAD